MFKLVVFSALLAVAAARPGLIGSPLVYSEPAYAKVGAIIKSVPTAVSHQSQSVVHSHGHVVEPIVAPVAVKTSYVAPAVHSYAAAPVYSTYAAAPVYAAAPAYSAHSYAAAPAYAGHTYAAASPLAYGSSHLGYAQGHLAAASPLTYTAAGAW